MPAIQLDPKKDRALIKRLSEQNERAPQGPSAPISGTRGKKQTRETVHARAAPGEGNRQADLDRLASLGWRGTYYEHATGEHWLQHIDGRTTGRQASYRDALDTALRMEGLKK